MVCFDFLKQRDPLYEFLHIIWTVRKTYETIWGREHIIFVISVQYKRYTINPPKSFVYGGTRVFIYFRFE